MKFLKFFLVFLFVTILFYGCKNDLKLNAPYKEIPSIYAVLNPVEKIHIIRINKVFLGETDANQMAQIADSINYPEGELEVTLTRKDATYGNPLPASKDLKQTIVFRDSVIQASPGAFNRTQRVYVCSDSLFETGKYTLTVKNKKNGNVFTASANSLKPVNADQGPFLPAFLKPPYYPYNPNEAPANYIDFTTSAKVSLAYLPNTSGSNGRYNGELFNLTIRLHFYDLELNNNKVNRYVDYSFANMTLKNVRRVSNANALVNEFTPEEFFSGVASNLRKMGVSGEDQIQGRKMYKIEFLVYTSTQEYIDYLQYVTPSLSISQSKPLYSNFENQAALGIFTFRTSYSSTKAMSTSFVSRFADNQYTCSFRFFNAGDVVPGCN